MTLTLATFMIGYLLVGYFLFSRGLFYINRLPGVGHLLAERIFYLMFFFFFLMLMFSNTIISYTMLFRSKETAWQLTLPIRHRTLFIWKTFESLIISSWALIFISAPLLAAHGQLNQAPPMFYVKAFLVYLPFVAIPAVFASWVLIAAVRYMNRYVSAGLFLLVAYLILSFIVGIYRDGKEIEEEGLNVVLTMHQVLEHTSLSVHPMGPSTWMSDVLVYWSKGFLARGYFFCLLIVAWALMGMLITYAGASRFFVPAWNTSVRRRARHSWNRRMRRQRQIESGGVAKPLSDGLRVPKLRRSYRSLVVKDFLIFWRDPAQWVQFVVIFGLLFLYVLNLRKMGYDYKSEFWSVIIAYLNLGVCSLALSTLTTRFVFPQFSLEGRRLWILGLAPFDMGKVVLQKFWFSWAVAGSLTVGLMILSGYMLELPAGRIGYFIVAISLMSIGLTAIAVGLGTIFPNLRESNPAKIVSGFGGTLCLILSFLYIVLFIFALALPAAVRLAKHGFFADLNYEAAFAVSTICVLGLTAFAVGAPLFFAVRRVKNLEILGNL